MTLHTAVHRGPAVTLGFYSFKLIISSQKLMAQHYSVCIFHSKALKAVASVHKIREHT